MKKLFLLVLFLVPSLAYATTYYRFPIVKVIDGDSIKIQVSFLPPELGNTLILREYGIDTPEIGGKAKCSAEAALAQKAKDFTELSIATATHHSVVLIKWDKYGGRVLGDIKVDGKSLKDLLLANGLAVEYSGSGPRHDWCN